MTGGRDKSRLGTCAVNNVLLVGDRKSAGLKQQDLVDLGAFTLPTLKRAESGRRRIKVEAVRAMARALGPILGFDDVHRYVVWDGAGNTQNVPLNITGKWHAVFVQDDKVTSPYREDEWVTVKQSGMVVSGTYYPASSEGRERYDLRGTVLGQTVRGMFAVIDRTEAEGSGCIQLYASRRGDWLEGFCTWLDHDISGRVCCSKHIWMRVDSQYYNAYVRDAEEIMNIEVQLFSDRRDTEK